MCGGINPRILVVVCRGRQTVTLTLQAHYTRRNSAILIIPHYVEWKRRKQEVLCPYCGAWPDLVFYSHLEYCIDCKVPSELNVKICREGVELEGTGSILKIIMMAYTKPNWPEINVG